jgi:hypothetical protein
LERLRLIQGCDFQPRILHFVRTRETVDQCGSETRELYLPKVQAKNTDVIIVTNGRVRLVFRVVNFWMNPLPLVIGIVNDPRFPLPLSKEPRVNMSLIFFHFLISYNQRRPINLLRQLYIRHQDSEQDFWDFFPFL